MHARWASLLLILLAGCVQTDPADDIGRFNLVETRTAHCGDGTLLAAPEERKAIIYLRQVSDSVLHWHQGDALFVLTYSALDGSFSAQGQALVDMRDGDTTLPTCIIARNDKLDGTLLLDDAGNPEGLEGHVQYDFEPSANSECDDLLAAQPPLAEELPCGIGYDFTGEPLD